MADKPRRYLLQEALEKILGSENVYFNPPENIRMTYPAIVYSVSRKDTKRADDSVYSATTGYDVMYIRKDPDSSIDEAIFSTFPHSTFNRAFVSDNLHHDVYVVYY